jgi:hypothetical protein
MSLKITAADIDGRATTLNIDYFPQECPVCNNSQYPKLLNAFISTRKTNEIQLSFLCTHPKCENLFIAHYNKNNILNEYNVGKTEPKHPSKVKISEPIENISPQFVNILNQSLIAEGLELDQLTGIGLRKALEFLIKDFAIHNEPKKIDAIKKIPLSKCIDNYIKDPKIKNCAKLATWLGNDETHYVRKWEDKDITDLKILIKLTTNWIENYLLTEKYKLEMLPNETDNKLIQKEN